jgi:hypothetical protein
VGSRNQALSGNDHRGSRRNQVIELEAIIRLRL